MAKNVLPPVEVAFAAKGVKKLQDALRSIADSLLVIQQRSATSSVQEVIHHNNVAAAAQRRAVIVGKSSRQSANAFSDAQRQALKLERQTVDDGIRQDRKIRSAKIQTARDVSSARRRELAGEDRDNARIAARSQTDWKTKQTERRRMLSGEDRDNMAIARRAETDWRRKESGRIRAERMLAREVSATAKTSGVRGFLSGAASNSTTLGRYASASGAEAMGMGAAGLAVGAFGLFTSALSMATSALSQFGGFLVRDIIGGQMKLLTQTTQYANRMGGGAALAGEMRGTVNGWASQYSSLTREQIMGAYGQSIDLTHDPKQAKTATNVALKLAHAYREDPTKIAKVLSYARADMPGLNDEEFEGYSTQIMRKTLQKGSGMNMDEMAGLRDRIGVLSGRFQGSGDSHERAATEIGLTGLAAVGSVGRGGRFGTGAMDRLIDELSRNDTMKKISGDGSGQLRPLAPTIAALVAGAHGNLAKLEADSKEGKSFMQYNLGGGYNKSSVDFLRALKVEETYRDAGGGKAGQSAVEALIARIMDVTSQGDVNAEAALVDMTPEQQLNKVLEDLQRSFDGLLPIVENALIPALKAAEPEITKFIARFSELIGSLDTDGLGDTFKSIAKAMAEMIFAIMTVVARMPGVHISEGAMDDLGALAGNSGAKYRKSLREKQEAEDRGGITEDSASIPGVTDSPSVERTNSLAAILARNGKPGVAGAYDPSLVGFNVATAGTPENVFSGKGAGDAADALAAKANEIGVGIGRGVSDWLGRTKAPIHPIGAGSREPQ